MSIVYTAITLKNAADIVKAECGLIEEKDVRSAAVTALADTGAGTLVINEAVRGALGLKIEDECVMELADGSSQAFGVTESVKVQWKNRAASCEAVVMPDADTVLLGAIPMEAMDLMVHPAKEEVVGAHGSRVVYLAK